MSQIDNPARPAGRRLFLQGLASGAGLSLAACATRSRAGKGGPETPHEPAANEAAVTPGEDLMQEHGVLERVLLIYDEAASRIDRSETFDVAIITRAAEIVRRFVEDYHERLEEQFVFPRLEAASREAPLVATLRQQHQRGREVTDQIGRVAGAKPSAQLAEVLRSFTRMYRPHAAREDTVLFPAFRAVVGRAAYAELGEQFEEQEHTRFGEHGFEQVVAEVARLEEQLGIHDLERFTAP
jgi:hemerythrin-like domain-containing protein